MTKVERMLGLAGILMLALVLLFGCARLFWNTTGQSGWYIRLNIGDPAAKAIGVEEYDVTEVYVELFEEGETVPFHTVSWDAGDGAISELIPVSGAGEYRIEVTHISENGGEPVEAMESATFTIQSMVITVIEVIPGCVGVIDVEPGEIIPEEPIDLTGYWLWYYSPGVGEQENGPILLYIQQTEEHDLLANIGINGFISDSTVTLFMPDYGVEMVGTVSGDEIAGEFTMVMPGDDDPQVGSFRMNRATETNPPFGHLELEGTVDGIEILLDTGFALGGPEVDVEGDIGGISTHFQARYITHEWDVWVWMSVEGAVPEIGEGDPEVVYDEIGIGLRWQKNGQGLDDYNIEHPFSGSMTLTRFDVEEGAAGSFNLSQESPTGDTLMGSFDLSWWEEWSPED